MKKSIVLIILGMSFFGSVSQAGPLWMATEVECSQFMNFLSVNLREGQALSENGPFTFTAHGMSNYESLEFKSCVTVGDNMIKCDGQFGFSAIPFKFEVKRNKDGTFRGILSADKGGRSGILGCLPRR